MSKSDLCRRYVEEKDKGSNLSESYLSAIICSFWSSIGNNYYRQEHPMATPEDCLDWMIDSILYCLEKHVWTDPKNSMYKDPKGPEKCINVCITSTRANYYVAKNRQKRKVALQTVSLEQLEKIFQDSDKDLLEVEDHYDVNSDFIARKIIGYFQRYEYFKAFVIHQIINNDFEKPVPQDSKLVEFDFFACKRTVRSMNDFDCDDFAYSYNLPLQDVLKARDTVSKMSYYEMQCNISDLFSDLRRDKNFVELLRSS